jgi:hypothetical protein
MFSVIPPIEGRAKGCPSRSTLHVPRVRGGPGWHCSKNSTILDAFVRSMLSP